MTDNGSVPGQNGPGDQGGRPPQVFGNQPGGWQSPPPAQGLPPTAATPSVQPGWGQQSSGQGPSAGTPPVQPGWGQQSSGQGPSAGTPPVQPGWGQQPGQQAWPQGAAQYGGAQPGGAQYGGAQPGGAQPGGAQYGASPQGGAQYGGAQPGGAQHDATPQGATQYGATQPGGPQYGGAQPGGQYGAQPGGQYGAQPGGAQYGPTQPDGAQYGTQPGGQYGVTPPGNTSYGQPYPPAGTGAPYGPPSSTDQGRQPGQQPAAGWAPSVGAQHPQAPWGAQPGGPGQQAWGYPPSGMGGVPGPNQPRRSNRAVLGVIGGVVGVALIGGTVLAVQRNNTSNPTPQPSATASNGQSVPPAAVQKPSDLVSSYLKALGTGDAQGALSMAAVTPTDTTMLTDEMLAKSTAGKLTDISVPEVSDENATSVRASYTLNGKPVTATFGITRIAGLLRLEQVAADVDVSSVSNVAVTVGGVRPKSDVVTVFPGSYAVAPVNKYYALATKSLAVNDLEALTPATRNATISSSGRSAIIKAVNSTYKACLKRHSTKPGCGFGVSTRKGVTLRTNTIKWTTRSGAKWSKIKPRLLAEGVAEASAPATVHFYARDAKVSGRYWYKDIKLRGVSLTIGSNKVSVAFY